MTNFDEYLRQSEPAKREKGYAWQTAIGLQAVDGLTPSEYLIETARQHIEGDITIDEVQERIKSYYQSKKTRTAKDDEREEADRASANITKLLGERSFAFTVAGFTAVHRRIFDGVFKFAGKIRDYNITKKEWVLDGDTVLYVSAPDLRKAIEYDIEQEKAFDYTGLSLEQIVKHITKFVSGLWQIHPFGEGNTRAVAVFTIQYLRSIGFNVENDLFAKHSWYFRNALVRANYQNVQKGVKRNPEYLERFFRNLLMGEKNELRNRSMHIGNELQSITPEISKSQIDTLNYTLEEKALLDCIRKNPQIKQQEIAKQIGKSISTVKRLTVGLVEKGIIERKNGKRNGFWEIKGI
ncbi:Fic family protein [Bacteroides sp. 51]|uniref:Fic family protein n=1 Tax=Bacteroides sp. 51 TaxID=2302938 RepID=UPI0013D6F7D2|nr:Fic family protein [Bacteroides sp. 51]NDV80904.1 winged helix-turn-helix transcriptional regulator [Bacteroides sp. 51]